MAGHTEVLRGPVAGADADRVRELAAETAEFDGVDALSEQFLLGIDGDGPHVLARSDAGDAGNAAAEVVGYAGVVVPPSGGAGSVEGFVAPSRRRQGLGAELIAAALDAAGADATVWAHGDLTPARELAESLRLRPVRTLLNLRRPLSDDSADSLDAAAAPPPGVHIRTYAGPSDDAALIAVNNAAFAWHPEQGGWGPEQIAERVSAPWFDPQGLFLAFDGDGDTPDAVDADGGSAGKLLGFHWTKAAEPGLGEVYVVAVAPEAQGRGLGNVLTAVGVRYLAQRGLDAVELYVEADNSAALRTYDRLGFSEHERHVAYARS